MTEVVERLNVLDIPAGPVYSLDQVFADPQVQHLGLVRDAAPGPTANRLHCCATR